MLLGYARINTTDQNLETQNSALKQEGCECIYVDEGVTGNIVSRPELVRLMDALREGDTVVFTAIDRLARNMRHLWTITERIHERGASLRAINQLYDTSTPQGKLVFQMMGTVAEFERDLIRERAAEGLKRAMASGKHCGRPFKLDNQQVDQMTKLRVAGTSLSDLTRTFGISHSTVRRYWANAGH